MTWTVYFQLDTIRTLSSNTSVTISYGTSVVEMEKEEWAFPLRSLIADCGGTLGLFVGFNFLMIWHSFVLCLNKTSHCVNRRNYFN